MPEFIADLHFHSKFSRAVSPEMNLENFAEWGKTKGIDVLGTADFTHPAWFAELKEKLEYQSNGLYKLKGSDSPIHFLLSTEISCIYTKNGKGRRIHLVVFAPDLATVEKIRAQLSWQGNLKSDGRPILGLDAKELTKIVLSASPNCLVIPAHIWTPWFSLFGSESGFDTLTECFDEFSDKIYAVETGLSSDPNMNWRLSQLDKKKIVSNSDAHSLANLGREATVFELENLSYNNILKAIRENDPKNKIAYTTEFFPEEGKYHWDGHRDCQVRFSPKETLKANGLCPKCGKRLTIGVAYRVEKLADREENFKPENRPPFKSLVPLEQIIAESLGTGVKTKGVRREYDNIIKLGKNEFNILINLPWEEIKKITRPEIAEGIQKVREKKLTILPGYDGVYGTVKVFGEVAGKEKGQKSLF
ncbi:MAG: endonuclease Q family protein [Patescibacteria group bacterium]